MSTKGIQRYIDALEDSATKEILDCLLMEISKLEQRIRDLEEQ